MTRTALAAGRARIRIAMRLTLAVLLSAGMSGGAAFAAGYDLTIRQKLDRLKVGQASVLTIMPHNSGPTPISSTHNVTVVVTLPGGLRPPPPAGIFPASWQCVIHGQTITCTYARGAQVAPKTLMPPISIFIMPTNAGPFTNCVKITMQTPEINTGNNVHCVSSAIAP